MKDEVIFIILQALLLAFGAVSVLTMCGTERRGVVVQATADVHIRTCPFDACTATQTVKSGTRLFVIEEQRGWLRVGESSWVSSDSTQRLGER